MGANQSIPSASDGDEATFPREGAKFAKEPSQESHTPSRPAGDPIIKSNKSGTPSHRAVTGTISQTMFPSKGSNGQASEVNVDTNVSKPAVNPKVMGTPRSNATSFISDNDVHVNLAMADLMAYLQVVADNSNNLPMTRRDDPEVNRTVCNLSAEEYAKKSAAFVPSDVRVIGGTFTRYGRVWDLPTSEEYNVLDGAQEPGESVHVSKAAYPMYISC